MLLAALIVAILATGCKKKDEPQQITTQEISFYSGEQVAINTNNNTSTGWTSSNTFVAMVKNDSTLAKHVGNCLLTATNGSTANVTVLPRYRFFQEPVTQWDIDTTSLLSRITLRPARAFCLDSANRSMIGVLKIPNVEATLYYFEDNKLKLTWSLIPKKDSVLSHMEEFMLERYEYMESVVESTIWSDATVHKYMNAYSPKDASTIVGYHDMILDETAPMIESMFGTNVLLGLVFQDASIAKFDTAWVESYINGLPQRLINQNY